MAYDANNLLPMTYANGVTHWHYRTGDSIRSLMEPDYWTPCTNMLRLGDMIFANHDFDGDACATAILTVTRATKSEVSVGRVA